MAEDLGDIPVPGARRSRQRLVVEAADLPGQIVMAPTGDLDPRVSGHRGFATRLHSVAGGHALARRSAACRDCSDWSEVATAARVATRCRRVRTTPATL